MVSYNVINKTKISIKHALDAKAKSDDEDEKSEILIVEDSRTQKLDEEIVFTGFLSDYDPNYIFVLTYSESSNSSFFKILKIYNANEAQEENDINSVDEEEQKDDRTFSQVEDKIKLELI